MVSHISLSMIERRYGESELQKKIAALSTL
jgi:hypothetical protein